MFKNIAIKDEKIEGINKMNKKTIINKVIYLIVLIFLVVIVYFFVGNTTLKSTIIFFLVWMLWSSIKNGLNLIKKTQRLTFYPKSIIWVAGSGESGPCLFCDLGDNELVDISRLDTMQLYKYSTNDSNECFLTSDPDSNSRLDDGKEFLGQNIKEGKNIIDGVRVEIILGSFSSDRKGNKVFCVTIDKEGVVDKKIDCYYIGHGYSLDDGYQNAVCGYMTLHFYENNKVNYSALVKNTFEARDNGEDFWQGLSTYVLNGKRSLRV